MKALLDAMSCKLLCLCTASTATREDGQGLVEYALILSFISTVAVAVMQTVGAHVPGPFQVVADALP